MLDWFTNFVSMHEIIKDEEKNQKIAA